MTLFERPHGEVILKLETLKSFTRLNMQQQKKEYDEDTNATNGNGTAKNIQ